jgi:DNA polymerase-1
MLVMLLRDNEPGGMAVAFDRPEPTFRDDIVEEYKGNRPDTPDLLIPQFSLVRQVLGALGIVMVEKAGYEADDILATLATQARDAGRSVVVVSGDRDTFQLVEDPLVKVMYTRRGISDTVVYDEAGIMERHGVSPRAYPTLAALRGDTSDNLPGVPGVGEKTAAKLVSTYGDLDTIFDHVGDQTPKLRQNLAAHEQQVRRNAAVIPLVRDVVLEVTLDDLTLGKWDPAETKRVFGELELRSAWQRLAPMLGGDADEALPRAAGTRGPPTVDLGSITAAIPVDAAAAATALLAAAEARTPSPWPRCGQATRAGAPWWGWPSWPPPPRVTRSRSATRVCRRCGSTRRCSALPASWPRSAPWWAPVVLLWCRTARKS